MDLENLFSVKSIIFYVFYLNAKVKILFTIIEICRWNLSWLAASEFQAIELHVGFNQLKALCHFLFLSLVPRHSRTHLTNQWPNFTSMWQKSTVDKKWKRKFDKHDSADTRRQKSCKHVIHQESKCDRMNFLFIVLFVLPIRNPFQILKFVNLFLLVQVKCKGIFSKVLLLLIF